MAVRSQSWTNLYDEDSVRFFFDKTTKRIRTDEAGRITLGPTNGLQTKVSFLSGRLTPISEKLGILLVNLGDLRSIVESRMREIRLSGSVGGGPLKGAAYPIAFAKRSGSHRHWHSSGVVRDAVCLQRRREFKAESLVAIRR